MYIFRHLKELSENRLDLTSIDSLEKSKIYYNHNNRNNKNQKNHNHRRNQNQNQNKKRK